MDNILNGSMSKEVRDRVIPCRHICFLYLQNIMSIMIRQSNSVQGIKIGDEEILLKQRLLFFTQVVDSAICTFCKEDGGTFQCSGQIL